MNRTQAEIAARIIAVDELEREYVFTGNTLFLLMIDEQLSEIDRLIAEGTNGFKISVLSSGE